MTTNDSSLYLLRYTSTVQNEHSLVAAFMRRNKRNRYREMLSNPRLRHKFTKQLAHFGDFDPRYRVAIPSNKLFIDNIATELKNRQCPHTVFVISEDSDLDQKELPLMDALEEIVGRGIGTVLSCIPGRLAFVETEDERFILERRDPFEMGEYIRFEIISKGEQVNNLEQGIFQAATLALEWRTVTGSDADELNELHAWFNKNLEKPSSVGRDALRRGICWFKAGATEHISRILSMAQILDRNGVHVKQIKTDKPGYVIYEDEWQLVAERPRKLTRPHR